MQIKKEKSAKKTFFSFAITLPTMAEVCQSFVSRLSVVCLLFTCRLPAV